MDNQKEADMEASNLEAKMKQLEEILDKLENNKLPLEESVELYEKGVALQTECQNMLDQLKLKVKKIDADDADDADSDDQYTDDEETE